MKRLVFREAGIKDLDLVTELLARLFTCHGQGELREENRRILQSQDEIIWLASLGDTPVGAAHVAVRHEYVEGAPEGCVSGYLEAIYVLPAYRFKGIARQLVLQCEGWSKEKGCKVLASDCELDNLTSERFHKKTGFVEVSRNIHFIKVLD
ncbi:MAG: GNAT family N-acetyltransferase [Clostridiaceae bacterium]|nr:GNAT family N-acetyltransferase [Clostridiaceae bacterium]